MTKADRDYETKIKDTLNLNDLRFLHFERSTATNSFKLDNLPPTEEAAKQHCLRVYLQVQAWAGNKLDATQYGWKLSKNGLLPVYTTGHLIPEEVLKKITCRCESGCKTTACGCKKHGLKCTRLCAKCYGESCDNIDDAVVEEDISNEQENDDIPENMFLLNICDNENISNKNVSDSNISDDENVPTKKQRI